MILTAVLLEFVDSTIRAYELLFECLLVVLDEGLDFCPPSLPIVLVDDLLDQAFQVMLGLLFLPLAHFDILAVLLSRESHL